jgi:flagellar biosynthesis anti-sigma factor FlgM
MRLEPVNSQIASEIKKVENAKKTSTTDKTKIPVKGDSHTFSSDATRLNDTKATHDIVNNQISNEPDVRAEKVEEVRSKIESGYYNTPEFIDKLAEKLLKFLGITK